MRSVFEAASEVFGGIKEIKLLGNENLYLKRFSNAYSRVARVQAYVNLAGSLPTYALELLAFGGGLLGALYVLQTSHNLGQLLPFIALYILCARRILPAFQRVFKNVTTLRYSQPAVNKLLEDFEEKNGGGPDITLASKSLPVTRTIALEGVSFAYPKAVKLAVSDLNLIIPVGTRVGFVGATGSGKTTAVDLILGLLYPTNGCIKVDGIPIKSHNVRRWQRNLGYVPQFIYLADDTVAANIALGLPDNKIDLNAVERAAPYWPTFMTSSSMKCQRVTKQWLVSGGFACRADNVNESGLREPSTTIRKSSSSMKRRALSIIARNTWLCRGYSHWAAIAP